MNAASLDGGNPRIKEASKSDADDSARPALAPSQASYWDVFDLVASVRISKREIGRRAEAREVHTQALARIIASEAGTASRKVKHTVAWIARNRSLLIKRPMFEMAAPGEVWGPITAKRPMSSSQPATEETQAIAKEVLAAPQSKDPTGGATHGFDTTLQDQLAAQGTVTNDTAAVIRIWKDHYGLEQIDRVATWVLYR